MKNESLNTLKDCFNHMCNLAYENAPDFDKNFFEEFLKDVERTEIEFNEAFANIEKQIV